MIEAGPFLGVVQKTHPSYLKPGYAAYARDVDFSRGSLKPFRSDRQLSESTGRTLYAEDCCIKTYDTCATIARDSVGCTRVFATGLPGRPFPAHTTPARVCADSWCRLGFPCLLPAPLVEYVSPRENADTVVPRSYAYTYVNEYGEESAMSIPSPVTNQDWDVGALISRIPTPSPEYCVRKAWLYALVSGVQAATGGVQAGEDGFFRIAQINLPFGGYAHDPTRDTLGQMNTTEDYDSFPADAKDIRHWGTTQLAFLSGDKLRFTEPHNYAVAPEKYVLAFQSKPIRLFVTDSYAYVLTCGRPEFIDIRLDCSQQGCKKVQQLTDTHPLIGAQSGATHDEGVVFASTEGLIFMRGNSAANLTNALMTKEKWDEIQPHTMRGAVHNGYYYGATDTDTFRVALPTSGNGTYAENFSWLSIRATTWYRTEDNRLLYTDAAGTWELGQGGSVKPYVWQSPVRVSYKPLSVSAGMVHHDCGDVALALHANGKQCADWRVSAKRTARTTMRFPHRLGYEHSIEISGTAEVYAAKVGTSTMLR